MKRQDRRYPAYEDRNCQDDGLQRPLVEPGLALGSYQNDPAHHGSHGGYWEREDTRQPRCDRSFLEKAGDEVQSWFGDEQAERHREHDHRGKGPRNYRRSDERISEDVHERLTHDHMLDASEISVTVSDREVTLDGTVDSHTAKRRAEDCAVGKTGRKAALTFES